MTHGKDRNRESTMQKTLKKTTAIVAIMSLSNCASLEAPKNIEPVATGKGYQAQYRAPTRRSAQAAFLQSATLNAETCLPFRGGNGGKSPIALTRERLTRNDLVEIFVSGDDTFGGSYVVSRDGTLKLPFLEPIRAQGRLSSEIEKDISNALLSGDYFIDRPRVSVRVKDFASVTVGVSGAVFEPHAVEIGSVSGDRVDGRRQDALGASSEGRNLSAALRAAGGIRPDADISAVELRRGSKVYKLDMRGVFDGENSVDIMLLTGDEVLVPSRQCFQDDLMRPSPISPPGISLFVSNLTQPATGNAPSANGRETRQVPYGTRYLQAAININCVGGAKTTSANRSAVLFSRNPETKVSVVIERNIEQLMRRPERDDFDPYLLPGDAIACYDSSVTNVTEVGRVLGVLSLGAL